MLEPFFSGADWIHFGNSAAAITPAFSVAHTAPRFLATRFYSCIHRSKCQDSVPASPYDEVDETVKEQLGRPLTELFASVDREALASASVAQVHCCTLKDGRKAVVKVRAVWLCTMCLEPCALFCTAGHAPCDLC